MKRDILRETMERTAEAWKVLLNKDLLPPDILEVVDGKIRKAIPGTE